MLNFNFSKKGLGLVPPHHILCMIDYLLNNQISVVSNKFKIHEQSPGAVKNVFLNISQNS